MSTISSIEHAKLTNIDSYCLVFVDGVFKLRESYVSNLPDGVILKSLPQAINENPKLIKPYIEAPYSTPPEQGVFLHIPEGVVIDKPIHLIYFTKENAKDVRFNFLNIIVAGKYSQALLLEEYIGATDKQYFNKIATNLYLKEGADIRHYKLQKESNQSHHEYYFISKQNQNSKLEVAEVVWGGKTVNDDLRVLFQAQGASCIWGGLYLPKKNQDFTCRLYIKHLLPNCVSDTILKGVVNDSAILNFNGRVIVHKQAQKSTAKLTNRNLLLSKLAQVATSPELEIYADDIQCSHAATVGQLDPHMLWYLRSRGIFERKARNMLIEGFVKDILRRFPSFIQDKANFILVNLIKD